MLLLIFQIVHVKIQKNKHLGVVVAPSLVESFPGSFNPVWGLPMEIEVNPSNKETKP